MIQNSVCSSLSSEFFVHFPIVQYFTAVALPLLPCFSTCRSYSSVWSCTWLEICSNSDDDWTSYGLRVTALAKYPDLIGFLDFLFFFDFFKTSNRFSQNRIILRPFFTSLHCGWQISKIIDLVDISENCISRGASTATNIRYRCIKMKAKAPPF